MKLIGFFFPAVVLFFLLFLFSFVCVCVTEMVSMHAIEWHAEKG